MDRLLASLPRHFPFFHLGHVELDEEVPASNAVTPPAARLDSNDLVAVAFIFQGDARGVLALLFEEGLDLSIYSELGNIIASQMVTDLSRRHRLEVTLSPPQRLTAAQLEKILKDGRGQTRTYLHHHEGAITRLQTWVISTENLGYAERH